MFHRRWLISPSVLMVLSRKALWIIHVHFSKFHFVFLPQGAHWCSTGDTDVLLFRLGFSSCSCIQEVGYNHLKCNTCRFGHRNSKVLGNGVSYGGFTLNELIHNFLSFSGNFVCVVRSDIGKFSKIVDSSFFYCKVSTNLSAEEK